MCCIVGVLEKLYKGIPDIKETHDFKPKHSDIQAWVDANHDSYIASNRDVLLACGLSLD